MTGKSKGINQVAQLGGSTADAMIARMEAFQAMSEKERGRFVREATKPAKKRYSEEDVALMMAADGYFDEND